MTSLGGHNFEIITVIGRLLLVQHPGGMAVAFHPRARHQRSQGTQRISRLRWPEKAVVLAGCAVEMLGISQNAVAHPVLAGVFPLRLHVRAANGDRPQLILPDATAQDFFPASRGVEIPLAIPLGQRNGKRPRVRPD